MQVYRINGLGYYTENDLRKQVRKSDVEDSKLPLVELIQKMATDYKDMYQPVIVTDHTCGTKCFITPGGYVNHNE